MFCHWEMHWFRSVGCFGSVSYNIGLGMISRVDGLIGSGEHMREERG